MLDVVFVVAQIVRLVRRIAEIYGGRPGLLGLVKLARSIGAISPSPAAWRSATACCSSWSATGSPRASRPGMGEGVLDGLLTAQGRTAALAVRRPAPFSVDKAPGVSDVAPFLFSGGKGE